MSSSHYRVQLYGVRGASRKGQRPALVRLRKLHAPPCAFFASSILLFTALLLRPATAAETDSSTPSFNDYILRAVKMIDEDRSGLGYKNKALTQEVQFGDKGVMKPQQAPYTMCVAAQLEVVVEALNLYAKETNDYSPFSYIPKSSWERLRPIDLRGQIWVVERAPSNGAADAFANFGMGDKTAFSDLRPGDLINFNRTNGTGHGAIFLAYLNAVGKELSQYSDQVAGFKYFSSQGTESNGGFGYRYAFFADGSCPTLSDGRRRDCGVIRSASQKLFNSGTLRMPNSWDRTKAVAQLTQEGLFAQAGDSLMLTDGEFNFNYFNGLTTDDQ